MEASNHISQMYAMEIIVMLGKRFKDYRIASNLTQQEVADHSGVSVLTIRNFENGRIGNVTLKTFIELLRTIGAMDGLYDVLPEIPISPYELKKIQQGKRKRVRHGE